MITTQRGGVLVGTGPGMTGTVTRGSWLLTTNFWQTRARLPMCGRLVSPVWCRAAWQLSFLRGLQLNELMHVEQCVLAMTTAYSCSQTRKPGVRCHAFSSSLHPQILLYSQWLRNSFCALLLYYQNSGPSHCPQSAGLQLSTLGLSTSTLVCSVLHTMAKLTFVP